MDISGAGKVRSPKCLICNGEMCSDMSCGRLIRFPDPFTPFLIEKTQVISDNSTDGQIYLHTGLACNSFSNCLKARKRHLFTCWRVAFNSCAMPVLSIGICCQS